MHVRVRIPPLHHASHIMHHMCLLYCKERISSNIHPLTLSLLRKTPRGIKCMQQEKRTATDSRRQGTGPATTCSTKQHHRMSDTHELDWEIPWETSVSFNFLKQKWCSFLWLIHHLKVGEEGRKSSRLCPVMGNKRQSLPLLANGLIFWWAITLFSEK